MNYFMFQNAKKMCCKDLSVIWSARDVLLNSISDVDVPGSFDYLQLFALVVDQKRGNHGQLELCFKFLR